MVLFLILPEILPRKMEVMPGRTVAIDTNETQKDGILVFLAISSRTILKKLMPITWKNVLRLNPLNALFRNKLIMIYTPQENQKTIFYSIYSL